MSDMDPDTQTTSPVLDSQRQQSAGLSAFSKWLKPRQGSIDLLGESKVKILETLIYGDKTADQMAKTLGINVNAVRGHMDFLEQKRFVESHFERIRVGRPRRIYAITDLGKELFPRRYDTLMIALLKVLKAKDEKFVNQTVEELAKEFGREARAFLKKDREAVEKQVFVGLEEILSEMGFKARLEGDGNNGQSRIIRTDCPILSVAKNDSHLICEVFDTTFLKSALHSDVSLTQTMAHGAKRCIHLIESGTQLDDQTPHS